MLEVARYCGLPTLTNAWARPGRPAPRSCRVAHEAGRFPVGQSSGLGAIVTQTERYHGPNLGHASGQQSRAVVPIPPAVATERTTFSQEDMHHPESIWTEPSNAQYPISVLRDTYRDHLSGRTRPASRATIRKYDYALESLCRSLELHGQERVLASITPFAVEGWISDCRNGRLPRRDDRKQMKLGEDSIASNLASVKAFTRKFVWKHLQMTTRDLLERVERYDPDPPMKPGLNEEQLEQVITCYGDDCYEDIRDKAMVAFYASSGLRFDEVLKLTINDVDPYSGWVKTVGKGKKERIVRITERARKYLRGYLHLRKARRDCAALWTTDDGKPLSYFGGQGVFRRLKKRSGVKIAHAHRFRHTWTQTALKKKAERALVQDAMGWSSDAMVRRYGGWVRSETAAAAMPEFAPL